MSGHLSIGDRWRIISLSLDQGMTTNQIASVINCTSRTVRNILQLFRETNNVIEREERGRTLLNKCLFGIGLIPTRWYSTYNRHFIHIIDQ
ncbi:unnamed protein product [Rotaria sp. Silwood1]|nr:unnamed protein product [Rotaria sp. Silwood1]CAF3492575.1 unnamed protein product [Rotaria sp. Silwood1]